MPLVYDDQQQPAPPARGRVVFDEQRMEDTVPGAGGKMFNPDGSEFVAQPQPKAPERSWLDDVGDFRVTPDLDLRGIWDMIKGAPETGLAAANNAGAAAIAGITAPIVGADDDDAANYTRDFMENNSYSPQGESAKKLSSAIGDAFSPIEGAKRGLGDEIMEHTGSPGLATAGYMAPDLASILMGPKPAAGKYGTAESSLGPVTTKTKAMPSDMSDIGDMISAHGERTPPPSESSPRLDPQDPVKTARAAGYKLLPSQVEQVTLKKPSLTDRMAEAIAPEDVRRDFTIDNQGVTQQLAREKVKAPEGATLDETGLDELREPHYQAYRDVEKAVEVVPPSEDYLFALDDATQRARFPKGTKPSVTQVISALRTKARKKMNNPNADEKIEQDGQLDRDTADALEDALGKRLEELGDTESLTKYQDARKALAELNDVDEAQQGGIVDAGKLHRRDDKVQKRITGQTKMAADVSERFPDATKSSLSAAGRKGAQVFPESREGVVKKIAKKSARGLAKVAGLGDRLLVESEGFQNRMGAKATPAERTYFENYGKKPELASSPGAVDPERGLDFAETNGVTPSKAVTLSDRLELAPEPVANPQQLPDKPDMMTADVPQRTRGDIEPDFDIQGEADKLAGDLELDVRSGTKDAIGQKELSDLLADQGAGDTKLEALGGRAIREKKQGDMIGDSDKSAPLQLTQKPKGQISATKDKRGNITVRHEAGGEMTAIDLPEQGVVQIKDSKVPEGSRGQGRGQAMANAILRIAKKDGRRLISDNRVSESAQAMWAALKKKGLNVKQNPATRQASGELVSRSELKPVFEILDDAVTE